MRGVGMRRRKPKTAAADAAAAAAAVRVRASTGTTVARCGDSGVCKTQKPASKTYVKGFVPKLGS